MDDEITETIALSGFDADGEPELRVMAGGELYVIFNAMPPFDCEDEEEYDNFDQEMSESIGVEVNWEDREFFLISAPKADTVERICAFVANYRKNKGVRRFEMSDGKADKFWEVRLNDCELSVKFGRIGTLGQAKVKEFDEPIEAYREREKLIREKTKKGYTEVELAAGEHDSED